MAAGGYFREHRSDEDITAELRGYVEQGFTLVKVVGGGSTPSDEERWIGTVRSAVGDEIDVAVDAHWSWRDVESARRTIERWDAFKLRWVEDPMWPEAIGAAAELRRHVRTPVAIGDELSGRWAFHEMALHGSADIWRVDAMAVGGLTEFTRIAALAATWGIPISSHIYPEVHAHCAAAWSSVMTVEWMDPAQAIDLSHQFLAQPARPSAGKLKLSSAPGFGIELDLEQISGRATEQYVC
jgi:L-alanine-DL-glutamate epimerase-like enolase superfamily enzyme